MYFQHPQKLHLVSNIELHLLAVDSKQIRFQLIQKYLYSASSKSYKTEVKSWL